MTTPSYAAGTTVPVERSKAELDGLLGKHGARNRVVGQDDELGTAVVGFELEGRRYAIRIPLPTLEQCDPDKKGALVQRPSGWYGRIDRAVWMRKQHEQKLRERWRVAVLLIKSKLEIVRLGASSFEREFLADLVLPNGHTAGEVVGGYMARVIANGYQGPLALPAHEAEAFKP